MMKDKDFMMQEQWTRWEPVSGLAAKYYADSIVETAQDGLRIILSDAQDERKKVLIVFPRPVQAYRNTNESFASRIINELDDRYGSDFYAKWTFFKVANSAYLTWLSEEIGEQADLRLKHFSFIVIDSVIDILDPHEPVITFLE